MLPVKKQNVNYQTLDEIRQRKDELLDELQKDNTQFTNLWNQVFLKRENASSKGEYISGLVSNGFVAVDTFLLIRKLIKSYGWVFGMNKKKKKR